MEMFFREGSLKIVLIRVDGIQFHPLSAAITVIFMITKGDLLFSD
jgi:hypothetical protein